MSLGTYFDKIYVLSLHKRQERFNLMKKRLDFCDITNYKKFEGVDGSVLNHLHKKLDNSNFVNSSYIACTVSHLSIYQDALQNNYEKILVLEDDCRIHRNANKIFDDTWIPDWDDLLYLGYIPLNNDCSMWDYSNLNFMSSDTVIPENLWGLYGYGITSKLMRETIKVYNESFPMELDRYFVKKIQPRSLSIAKSPQLFCADDGYSDNSKVVETGMMERSIDRRFANLTDYI